MLLIIFLFSCQQGLDIDYEELATVCPTTTSFTTDVTMINDSIACMTSYSSKHVRKSGYKKERTRIGNVDVIKYNSDGYSILNSTQKFPNITSVFHDNDDNIFLIDGYIHKDSLEQNQYDDFPKYIDYYQKIYKSDNYGKTWNEMSVLPANTICTEVTNNGDIFITVNVNSYAGYGVYKSKDGGRTWLNMSRGLPVTPKIDFLYSNTNDRLFAVVEKQLFVSDTYGYMWELLRTHDMEFSQIYNYDKSSIYIGMKKCINSESPVNLYLSQDYGMTWDFWMEFKHDDEVGHLITDYVVDSKGKLILGMTPYGLLTPGLEENTFQSIDKEYAYKFLVEDLEINSEDILLVATTTNGLLIFDLNEIEMGDN